MSVYLQWFYVCLRQTIVMRNMKVKLQHSKIQITVYVEAARNSQSNLRRQDERELRHACRDEK